MAHRAWEELAALAAMEALPAADAAYLADHLASCAQCRSVAADYQLVAGKLAHAISMVQAPAHLQTQLRQRLRSHRRSSWTLPWTPPWSQWLTRGIAVAVLATTLVLGLQNVQLRQDLAAQQQATTQLAALNDPAAQLVTLVSGTTQHGAGRLVWAPNQPVAALAVTGLPPVPTEQGYQLWFVQRDGTVIMGGRFRIGADGLARISITAPAPWSTFAELYITEAAATDGPEPATIRLLTGTFDS